MKFPWRGIIVRGEALLLSSPYWNEKRPADGVIGRLQANTQVSVESQNKTWLYVKTLPEAGSNIRAGYVAQEHVLAVLPDDLKKIVDANGFRKGLDGIPSQSRLKETHKQYLGRKGFFSQKADQKLYHIDLDIHRTVHPDMSVEYTVALANETPLDEYEERLRKSLSFEWRFAKSQALEDNNIIFDVIFTLATFGGGKVVTSTLSKVLGESSKRIVVNGTAKGASILVKSTIKAVNKAVFELTMHSSVCALSLMLGLIPGLPSFTSITKYPLTDLAASTLWSQMWGWSLRTLVSVERPWVVGLFAEGSSRLLGALQDEQTGAVADPARQMVIHELAKLLAFRKMIEKSSFHSVFMSGVEGRAQK